MTLRENPLVVRFIRTGFRRGKGSFGIWVLGAIFTLIVLVNTVLFLLRESMPGLPYEDFRAFARSLFYQLLGFNFFNLVFLGSFRVYGTAMRERMESTLEALRLSPLSPSAVIRGMLLGLQVPGYLFLVLSLPLSLLCALGGGASARVLVLTHAFLIAATLFFSVLALATAVRFEKRSADATMGLALVALIFGASYSAQVPGSTTVHQLFQVFHPAAVVFGILGVQTSDVAIFYGRRVPAVYLTLAGYALVTAYAWHVLARTLLLGARYRPWFPGALAFYGASLFFVQGLMPDVSLGPSPALRAGYLAASLLLVYALANRRAVHREEYFLRRSLESSGGASTHPFGGIAAALVPFFVLHTAADWSLWWRMGGHFDPWPAVIGFLPIAAALLAAQALELGSRTQPGKRGRALFSLVLLVPLILALVIGGALGDRETMVTIAAMSPPVPAILLALREEGLAEAARGGWLAAGGASVALLLAAALLSGRGHRRILERRIARMEAAARAPEAGMRLED